MYIIDQAEQEMSIGYDHEPLLFLLMDYPNKGDEALEASGGPDLQYTSGYCFLSQFALHGIFHTLGLVEVFLI
jgi:hypothetical protein